MVACSQYPILEQTVAALKNHDHPWSRCVGQGFWPQYIGLTKSEALATTAPTLKVGYVS